jgi:uncharacterized OB-fold protein
MEQQTVIQKIQIPYKYTSGQALLRFFRGLIKQQIWASCCGSCGRVHVPPTEFCGRCWQSISDWQELPAKGELISYTTRQFSLDTSFTKSPKAFGLIKLEGADTSFVHLIAEVEAQKLFTVKRVEAIWREKRKGSIFDIAYFVPADSKFA